MELVGFMGYMVEFVWMWPSLSTIYNEHGTSGLGSDSVRQVPHSGKHHSDLDAYFTIQWT
jgi:hypothetical protein